MANSNRVIVSPGNYFSERDLTFVSQSVGVTTLGLAGETQKGPAFEPVFVGDYDEFRVRFGGTNPAKYIGTGLPKYELPYIAKSYLTESNQLFVTRILGLSGYDAGEAWSIKIDGAVDPDTTGTTESTTFTGTFVSTGSSLEHTFSDPRIDLFVDQIDLEAIVSDTDTVDLTFIKTGDTEFLGAVITIEVTAASGGTGTTTGTSVFYSGTSNEYDDMVVATIRSRGDYSSDVLTSDVLPALSGGSGVVLSLDNDDDIFTNFTLSAYTSASEAEIYTASIDDTKRNYISKVVGSAPQDKETSIWVEEIYPNLIQYLSDNNLAYGLKDSVEAITDINNYNVNYLTPETPYVVSEIRGNKIDRLFKFVSISDGDSANQEIKVSIVNIDPTTKEFDIIVRDFFDTDARPVVIERFPRCTMDPNELNYVGVRIGSVDGTYELKSKYIMLDLMGDHPEDAFPAGFEGLLVRAYGTANPPVALYKTAYDTANEKIRRVYLGLSDTTGIDQDLFDFKGLDSSDDAFTGRTKGFHMDVNATGATVNGAASVEFEVGSFPFKNESDIEDTDYEKINSRKFTLAPFGGFDGWDIYRDQRTNGDRYKIGKSGFVDSGFDLLTSDRGNSDYYAYLDAIQTFENPESVNINVFATPGIDFDRHLSLVEESIEMIEQDRADSIYILTTPDTDTGGDPIDSETAVDLLDSAILDSNYSATYFPWIKVRDNENSVNVFLPPTIEVVRNLALTDNVAFPWFAFAGFNRGLVNAIRARLLLTQDDRDTLYKGRINPMATFTDAGVVIFGNKTLQIRESALDRITIRRLLLQTRKLIAAVGRRLLFDPNDERVRDEFLSLVNPILDNIRAERGLTDFRVVLSDDPEDIDRNKLSGKIYLKPTPTLEFIDIEFLITPTTASFEDV